jgi:hypothetical protein
MNSTAPLPFSLERAREAITRGKTDLEKLFPELMPFTFEEVRQHELPTPRIALTFSYKTADFPFPRFKVVELDLDDLSFQQVTNR